MAVTMKANMAAIATHTMKIMRSNLVISMRAFVLLSVFPLLLGFCFVMVVTMRLMALRCFVWVELIA
ncbi:MAG: hypothetical protein NHB15_12250 [Methanosarcina barkeri]|nr:hypothetical protein [Methanosarcina sp. ERenArc_MAG2]